MLASTRAPPARLAGHPHYSELKAVGSCLTTPQIKLNGSYELIGVASLSQCLNVCDELHETNRNGTQWFKTRRRCEFVEHNEVNHTCTFMGPCKGRVALKVGTCARRYRPSCFYTRGPTFVDQVEYDEFKVRIRRKISTAAVDAKRELERQQALREQTGSFCRAPHLSNSTQGVLIESASPTPGQKQSWRYYSVFDCSNATHTQLCLTFKVSIVPTQVRSYMGLLVSSDGQTFHSHQAALRMTQLPSGWNENTFLHNVAILPLGGGEYAMLGGQQGFVSSEECRKLARKHIRARMCRPKGSHAEFLRAYSSFGKGQCTVYKKRKSVWFRAKGNDNQTSQDCIDKGWRHQDGGDVLLECVETKNRHDCLQLDDRQDNGKGSAASAPAAGILLSRGRGLPWEASRWSMPNLTNPILTGATPTGCVDRRPPFTGYPRILACEFDGRLSLVRHESRFRLYARANLKFQAVTGGRHVQTTDSASLDGPWQPWQPVTIAGIDPEQVDIYFFAVQQNPVDPRSLVAIFPLTHPPQACIMIAFSVDGVSFSRPVNLLLGRLGWRTNKRDGTGGLEFRSEDMPAAGIVRAPGDASTALFYVHHAVKGTTMRAGAIPHVRVYRLPVEDLAHFTRVGLAELRATGIGAGGVRRRRQRRRRGRIG